MHVIMLQKDFNGVTMKFIVYNDAKYQVNQFDYDNDERSSYIIN